MLFIMQIMKFAHFKKCCHWHGIAAKSSDEPDFTHKTDILKIKKFSKNYQFSAAD